MSTELTPAEKAKRTRLINEGIELSQEKRDCEARLKEIQETLWDFAEAELAATGQKTCTFTTPQGSCEVTEATNLTIAEETVANLRAALGDRFDELVKTQEKLSITDSLKRILQQPQPNEKSLAEKIRMFIKARASTRFSFKSAA